MVVHAANAWLFEVACVSRYSRNVQMPTVTATARRAVSSLTPKIAKKAALIKGNIGG